MDSGRHDEQATGQGIPVTPRENPEDRARRIQALKRLVQDGSYRPSLVAVADELLCGGHLSFDHEE